MELLQRIYECPNVQLCLDSKITKHHCKAIVMCQQATLEEFHLPEPWSGDLKNAPILFLSSNPSIAKKEKYPVSSWTNEQKVDFFINRFNKSRPWVKNGLFPLMQDGTYKDKWVRFWAALKKRSQELLGEANIRSGIDYAITEVVHCKSKAEIGVKEALNECVHRYLKNVLEESGAKVVVCLGSQVSSVIQETYNIPANSKIHGPVPISKGTRYFAFLPHPNARAERSFAKRMPEELKILKEHLMN